MRKNLNVIAAYSIMMGLIILVGIFQSWNIALSIFNLCLISAVMTMGANIQWGYAGLINFGIMGYTALGGLAAVLISVNPVQEAWSAGGFNILLSLFLITGMVLAENTIIAIVNNAPISLHSLKDNFLSSKTVEEKIEILNAQIDITLQLQKVSEFNLRPTYEDVEAVLNDVAKNNNLSMNDLLNFDEIDSINNEIVEKLSILNLQRFITRDLVRPTKNILNDCSNTDLELDQKQIKIAQIIISEVNRDLKGYEQKNILIESFLNKLSSHISKGASFGSFAKLHSQHPSYQNGGATDWLTVDNPTLEMLDSLDKNEVSEIYSTDFGLAIAIKIDERFISSKLKACEERVIYQNAEIYYTKWLKNLREQAFIEIYDDKLK